MMETIAKSKLYYLNIFLVFLSGLIILFLVYENQSQNGAACIRRYGNCVTEEEGCEYSLFGKQGCPRKQLCCVDTYKIHDTLFKRVFQYLQTKNDKIYGVECRESGKICTHFKNCDIDSITFSKSYSNNEEIRSDCELEYTCCVEKGTKDNL